MGKRTRIRQSHTWQSHIWLGILLLLGLAAVLSGCASMQNTARQVLRQTGILVEKKQPDYSQVTDELDATAVEAPSVNGYYVCHGGLYYPCILADWLDSEEFADDYYNMDAEELQVAGHKFAVNRQYDTRIPTLYLEQGDTLVYYSDVSILDYYVFAKYFDLGYSIPIVGYQTTVAGYPYITIDTGQEEDRYACRLLASSMKTEILEQPCLEGDDAAANMMLLSLNGTAIDEAYINNGILDGLEKNVDYLVNATLGSNNYNFTAAAEYHYFLEGELYAEATYHTLYDNTYKLDIPAYLTSGYYMLDNGGIFRLVVSGDAYDLYNAREEQFNEKTLYLDMEYALANGGSEDEYGNIRNASGAIVSDAKPVYSSNQKLNHYNTIVPGALGFQPDGMLAEQLEETEKKDREDFSEMQVSYFLLSPKEGESMELEAGTILYSLVSSLEQTPCMITQYDPESRSGHALTNLPAVRGDTAYSYTAEAKKDMTRKNLYIACYYVAESGLKFDTLDAGLLLTELTDLAEVPQELLTNTEEKKRK